MKVVLLHDWVTGFRGGERVLDAFCELFPEAPLYTLVHIPGASSARIDDRKVTASFLNKIPGVESQYRKFLPLFPKAAEHLKIVEKADLVLSSSHCVIKGVQKPAGARHLSYIHSPMRYLYDQFDTYFGPGTPLVNRLGMKVFRSYLTQWDLESNHNVDTMIANSGFVAERIRRIYGLPSDVVHPFVDLSDFRDLQASPPAKKDYDLILSAFAPNKRLDLAVEAYNQTGRRLVIIGSGQLERELKASAQPNIEFLGNLSRAQVLQYLFEARALIFPGVEDFGITPLEALGAGTPVVAFSQGGVLETLTPDTSVFFDEPTVDSLKKALIRLDERRFERSKLEARAEAFSRSLFLKRMQDLIEREMNRGPQA